MNNLQGFCEHQHLNDHWDLDHSFERMLVDTAVTPEPGRRELDQPQAEIARAVREYFDAVIQARESYDKLV